MGHGNTKIKKNKVKNSPIKEHTNQTILTNSVDVSNIHTTVYNKNYKHLICDDAHTNRLVLKKYLEMYKCSIDEAENGEEAINKVKENGEYNIIWMDIKMPKMDGHQCTKILRQDMDYKGLIIALTGYVDDKTVKKCYDLGMNYVLAKPFDPNVILMHVEESNKRTEND